jgi:hypothetical protein
MVCLARNYYWGEEMKEDYTGSECDKNMGED